MTYWNGAGWEADRPADPPRRRRGRRFLGAAAEAGLITLLIFGLIAGTALGAKGGKVGGGARTTAALSFSASPVTVGDEYVVTGTGFAANRWVAVGAYYSDTTWWGSAVTDAQGSVRITFTATSSGEVLHEAWEEGRNGSLRLKGSAILTVNPAAP